MTLLRRKTKKQRKFRGTRVCGYGRASGGHRKSGARGGFGGAGFRDHHWIQTVKSGRTRKRGFVSRTRSIQTTINVGEVDENIQNWLSSGLIPGDPKKPEKIPKEIDLEALGYDKVLGRGTFTKSITIKAPVFTEKAKAKIEAAGGSCLSTQETPEDEE